MARIGKYLLAISLLLGIGSAKAQSITSQPFAQIPAKTDNVVFVSPEGSDSNNCKSMGSACLTVYNALLSLPRALASPATAGAGIVEIMGSVAYGGPLAPNGGFYLLGPQDPVYPAPPSGWLNVSGAVSLECIAPNVNVAPVGHTYACLEAWGSGSDNTKPPFWISGVSQSTVGIHHFQFQFQLSGGRIGITTAGSRVGGGAQEIELDAVGVQLTGSNSPTVINGGPALDLADNVFWIWIHDSAFEGSPAEMFAISSIVRSSNVVTVTTTTNTDFVTGDQLSIKDVTDKSYDSYVGGTYTVVSASGTTITFNQAGPNSSSSGGWAYGERAAAINIRAPSMGAAQIQIQNSNTGGGAIRLSASQDFTSLYVQNLTEEGGDGVGSQSAILLPQGIAFGLVRADNVQLADTTGYTCAIEVDNSTVAADAVDVDSSGCAIGPVSARGLYPPAFSTETISPLQQGQNGIFNGHITGLQEAPKRTFSPTAVRFTNLAITTAANWTNSGNTTFTSGIAAPDGTTGAGQFASTSGNQNGYLYPQTSQALSVGDTLVGGAWVRSQTANGFSQGTPLVITGSGSGIAIYPCMTQQPLLRSGGDGEWNWVSIACTVTVASTGSNFIALYATYDTTHTIQVYGPVFNYIPAGTISLNEVYAYANGLTSYGHGCVVGTVCGLDSQVLASAAIFPVSVPVASLPSAATSTGQIRTVNDSTTISAEGQTCTGGNATPPNVAIAFSNGSVWKCF